METITIKFDELGDPQIDVKGIKGKSCKDVTAFLEKGLGKIKEDKLTREFYEKEPNVLTLRR